ncbi:MAG: hypothetical protein U1F53_00930 [Burkholderiaceae bacterium]
MRMPPAIPPLALAWLLAAAGPTQAADGASCDGAPLPGVGGRNVKAVKLADGGVAAFSGMNINIDGYAKAYHPRNREAGAVLHLCVGARVWLPDGSSYEGSDPPSNCTGKFMADMARIAAAGWTDASVGAVEWYGVAAEGSVKIAGRTVRGVKPLLQKDGSGFYVSPTSLVDRNVPDIADQRRYPNPLRVPSAVVPRSVAQQGVSIGSFGVAIHTAHQKAVPFVVGDAGPRVGEGSPALARQVSGMAPSDDINLKNRYDGQVDQPEVLWVFFGGDARPYDHEKEGEAAANAQAAFERWGGPARLAQCLKSVPRP